jgi:quinol monooxygenase YgiN
MIGVPGAHRCRVRTCDAGRLQKEDDTIMLYEVDASSEAFEAHWTGPSMQQAKQDTTSLQVSLSGVRCDFVE